MTRRGLSCNVCFWLSADSVGVEDSIYVGKGELAKSNADQVKKIRHILETLSLEIATPDEARQILQLKGGDKVGF